MLKLAWGAIRADSAVEILLVKGKLEDVQLPVEKVDIIISEVRLFGSVSVENPLKLIVVSGWVISYCTSPCSILSSSHEINTW